MERASEDVGGILTEVVASILDIFIVAFIGLGLMSES